MAYDEGLAHRINESLEGLAGLVEKKMFGGIGYLIDGNMACGVNGDDLIVRVGADSYEATLEEPFVRPFDFTGRPMKGWVVVSSEGCESDDDLQRWIQRGVAFAQSLPAK